MKAGAAKFVVGQWVESQGPDLRGPLTKLRKRHSSREVPADEIQLRYLATGWPPNGALFQVVAFIPITPARALRRDADGAVVIAEAHDLVTLLL